MAFFEPPPPPEPPEPEDYEQPEWLRAPENVLGAAVPLRVVLARTEDVAVAITDASAYPGGFELNLAVRRRALGDWYADDLDPLMFHPRHARRADKGELPPELLRFGIEFADGSKATISAGSGFADPTSGLSRPSCPRAAAEAEV